MTVAVTVQPGIQSGFQAFRMLSHVVVTAHYHHMLDWPDNLPGQGEIEIRQKDEGPTAVPNHPSWNPDFGLLGLSCMFKILTKQPICQWTLLQKQASHTLVI